jgi:hypothetical protein
LSKKDAAGYDPMTPAPLPDAAGAEIDIPLLCPRSKELVAANVAAPLNVMSRIAAHEIAGVPDATDIVVAVPSVDVFTVTGDPVLPVKFSVAIV